MASSITFENSENSIDPESYQISPPMIWRNVEDCIVEPGCSTILEAKVLCASAFSCLWLKDGVEMKMSERVEQEKENDWYKLIIKQATSSDTGLYMVVFKNEYSRLSRGKLYVAPTRSSDQHDGVLYTYPCIRKSLSVIKPLHDSIVPVGSRIDLEAEFNSAAVKGFEWYLNNLKITNDNEAIRITTSNDGKSSRLQIFDAMSYNTGVYTVVATTKHGVASSFADVVVTNINYINNNNILEELLPEEVAGNEGEEIRLICKVNFTNTIRIKWTKDKLPLEFSDFVVADDYGWGYIGLTLAGAYTTDSGRYAVELWDETSRNYGSCDCCVTIYPYPVKEVPIVHLKKPLESVIAVVGAKISFDCAFTIEDLTYFYVVWHIGHYRVERSTSRFNVVFKNGEYLLHIKRLEPDMVGEVVCELRKSLPNQKSIHINFTAANLAIVPKTVLEREMRQKGAMPKGRIFRELHSKRGGAVKIQASLEEDRQTYPWNNGPTAIIPNGSVDHTKFKMNEPFLVVQYCNLDDGTFYFIKVSNGGEELRAMAGIVVYDTDPDPDTGFINKIVEWKADLGPPDVHYAIGVLQEDGNFARAGVSSFSYLEIRDPSINKSITFEISAVPKNKDRSETRISIEPPKPRVEYLKARELKPLEKYESCFTSTDNIVGTGAFGIVRLVKDSKGNLCAAKTVRTRTQKKRDIALREYEMLIQINHPRLVRLEAAFKSKDHFIYVMDYLWGGELFDRIVEEDHIAEVDVFPYIRQICEALEYLHAQKIAHLDLKPENIMCLSPNSGEIKIIDFGLARILDEHHITRAIYGTKDYVAPEILNFEDISTACDMWSLGVVTYTLLSGLMPFDGENWPTRSANIVMGNYAYNDEIFENISSMAKDFIDRLLVVPPKYRMSAADALNHPWIKAGPPKGSKSFYMKRARDNLRSYLANYKVRWQRAGNVMIAAHRLRAPVYQATSAPHKSLEI